MAKKTLMILIDDFSGEELAPEAGRTVAFSFDGTNYEIDLSNAHIAEFAETIGKYTSVARKAQGTATRRRSGGGSGRSASELAAIREWAREQGHKVAERGRVAASIIEAYNNR